jgi:CRISPR type IV-associated protein Csf3
MKFEPLKIRWTLVRPMIARTHEIHLDALLARARVIEAGEDWSVQHDLPLERAVAGDAWCFKASALVFEPAEAMRLTHMTRRTDPTRIALDGDCGGVLKLRLAEINTGSGPLKGYSWFQSTQWVSEASAWCVGDAERIAEMLVHIQSLGKLGRNGFGLIDGFEIAPAPEPEVNHWLYRSLPVEFNGADELAIADSIGVSYAQGLGRCTPPYWSSEKALMLEPVGFNR